MDVNGKVWGVTGQIFNKNNVVVDRIQCHVGHRSSMHKHEAKHTLMFIERGSLAIFVEKTGYKLTDKTVLVAGQSTVIRPGEYHRFEVLKEGTVCYEISWVELDVDDIVRRDCGA